MTIDIFFSVRIMIDKFPLRMDNQARTPHNEIAECPACGFSAGYFVTVEEYHVFRCTTCGHGFVHPFPSEAVLMTEYSTTESKISNNNGYELLEAYKRDPEAVRAYFGWFIDQCRSIISDADNAGQRILDLGCSTGVFLRCLSDAGYSDVTGLEINREAVKLGRDGLGLRMLDCPVEDMAQDEKYDLIMAFFFLSHLRDPAHVLRMLYARLNKGGAVFFVVPNFSGLLRTVMGKKWLWYLPPFHLHHYTVNSLKCLADSCGFEIEQLYTTNTGTYLYLIHCLLFGLESTQNAAGKGFRSMRSVKLIDTLARLLLSPIIVPCKLANKEAHIVGVLRKP
jgi:2-polyprenyl-3-methyl-5-hydroxy-6-metoxy-1,4-benzoquinol methylase